MNKSTEKKKWIPPELIVITAVTDECVLLKCGNEHDTFGQGENHTLPCYQIGVS